MEGQLSLGNIRNALARLEETIIFGLIERAQFRQNETVYVPGRLGEALGGESLLDFLLHECERSHARVRRYTSPDEHPFFSDLPAPVLPALSYSDSPLQPNSINVNARIREVYEKEILSRICQPGDDGQWGSSAVNDVNLLQALSKRIHYGKFVAESKYRQAQERFDSLIRQGDASQMLAAITDRTVESKVLDRVYRKTAAFARELEELKVEPGVVREIYERWIIPMNKDVQVRYLLARSS